MPRNANTRSPEVEKVAQRARAQMAADGWVPTPFEPLPPLSLEALAWVREFIDSGELCRELDAVGNEDPQLAQ
jgi:hypothetical protein